MWGGRERQSLLCPTVYGGSKSSLPPFYIIVYGQNICVNGLIWALFVSLECGVLRVELRIKSNYLKGLSVGLAWVGIIYSASGLPRRQVGSQ